MAGIASSATAVVIAHVGAATSTIRIGAGGIMLPNHAPLVIAEQFGTLDALFPGPDRSRARPRAGQRPARRAGDPPHAGNRPQRLPARRARAAELFRRRRPDRHPRDAGRGREPADCGSSAPACSARNSPRCSACPSRSRRTSRPMRSTRRWRSTAATSARRRARQALCDGWVQRVRRRHRRGSRGARQLAAASVRRACAPATRASSRRRSPVIAKACRRSTPRSSIMSCNVRRWAGRDGRARARRVRRAHGRRRSDGVEFDLRRRRAQEERRARRRGDARA